MHILTAATAVVVLCAGAACAIGRFPGLADKATFVSPQGKGPWELKDPTSLLKEFNSSKFPPNVGLRARSCAALESKQKVHGTEKMADQINPLATGLLKVMTRTLPPLQRVGIGMISDACSGFWKVQFTVGEGKRCEKLLLEGAVPPGTGISVVQDPHNNIPLLCTHCFSLEKVWATAALQLLRIRAAHWGHGLHAPEQGPIRG